MSNNITNTLPPSLDTFLMDMAQMNETVNINYTDISEFGKRATPEDIKKLKNLKRKYYYHYNEDEETEKEIRISLEIRSLILNIK
jgi:hypothetical protein